MSTNLPPPIQLPSWSTANFQTIDQFGNVTPQSIPYLNQNQTNSLLQRIQTAVNAVSGAGGQSANITGPLSLNSNPITGVTNSSPPSPDEALSAGTAASLYSTLRQAVKTVTKSYSILATDGTILVNSAAGPVVLTLPDATTVGGYIWPVMKIDSSANAVSYATVKSQTVSGPATSTTTQWGKLWIQSDGARFWIINS